MLKEMGQTKQTFYETFTRTALRERSIPFIISLPAKEEKKMKAGKRWRLLPDWRLQGRRLAGRWITVKSARKSLDNIGRIVIC